MSDSETSTSSHTRSRSSSPGRCAAIEDSEGYVIDIGGSRLRDTELGLTQRQFLRSEDPSSQQRVLPSSLFHNDIGLRMWADITRLPNYYQTRDEIELLKINSRDLAMILVETLSDKDESLILIDLGCGNVSKIQPLLDTMESMHLKVQYFALDLSREVLVEAVYKLRSKYRRIKCFGLWGSFADCWSWSQHLQSTKCYMSLGSMLGNDHFGRAVEQLSKWARILRPQDRILLGLDGTTSPETIWRSYHDDSGLFHDFIRNGLQHSNEVLGDVWYKEEDWKISGECHAKPTMHNFVVQAVRNVQCVPLQLSFKSGDRIVCYEGFKYGPQTMMQQFNQADLHLQNRWCSPSGRICRSFQRPLFMSPSCTAERGIFVHLTCLTNGRLVSKTPAASVGRTRSGDKYICRLLRSVLRPSVLHAPL